MYSLGSASSISGVDFDCAIRECDRSDERTDDARRGIGSSGFADCFRSGSKGLYGCGCLMRDSVSTGISFSAVSVQLLKDW